MSKKQKEIRARRGLGLLKKSEKIDASGIKYFESEIAKYDLKAKEAKRDSAKKTYSEIAASVRKSLADYKEKTSGFSAKREELKKNIQSRLKILKDR